MVRFTRLVFDMMPALPGGSYLPPDDAPDWWWLVLAGALLAILFVRLHVG